MSRRIVEFAKKHGATIIVFEHLGNLRPEKGKYSRRSNSKRQYWLKSKVYNRTKDKALADYGILTVRVSPKSTSRVFAYDNSPVLRGNQISDTGFVFKESGMGSLFLAADGTIGNADLNSARNIGLRYIAKYIEKPVLKQTGLVRCALQLTRGSDSTHCTKGMWQSPTSSYPPTPSWFEPTAHNAGNRAHRGAR